MATFRALNVDYEDIVDDEPDNTKEVEIEEALKIYANALKYHQGKHTLKDAGDAYEELFKSEIFTYPESLSEYKRAELYGQPEHETILEVAVDFEPVPVSTEAGPSTLPQVLHLSYKNRGQYYLDLLQTELEQERTHQDAELRKTASRALDDFVDALDKDDDDVDLWRKAAKVGGILGSQRVARFCLEGALDGDEYETDELLGMNNIETSVAAEDLEQLEDTLQDIITSGRSTRKINVPRVWKEKLQLYNFLPEILPPADNPIAASVASGAKAVLHVSEPTWVALVKAVLEHLRAEDNGSAVFRPGTTWSISIPEQGTATGRADSKPENVATDVQMTDSKTDCINLAERPGVDRMATEGIQTPITIDKLESSSLPVRKRSTDVANISEVGDSEKPPAKRPRTRKSMAAEEGAKGGEPASDYDFQLASSTQADQWLFDSVSGIVTRLGANNFGAPFSLRALVSPDPIVDGPTVQELEAQPLGRAVKDFYAAILSWDSSKTELISQPTNNVDSDATSPESQHGALLTFLESSNTSKQESHEVLSNEGLQNFVLTINAHACGMRDIARLVLSDLLCVSSGGTSSGYIRHVWEAELKEIVCHLVVTLNEDLVEEIQHKIEAITDAQNVHPPAEQGPLPKIGIQDVHLAQTVFELQLDIFATLANLGADNQASDRARQRDRLEVWAELARETINLCSPEDEQQPSLETLKVRHLWTSVYHLGRTELVTRDHMVACLSQLQEDMISRGNVVVELPNNGAIPDLSTSAAAREITKLETMDFFLGIFDRKGKHPVDLIEDLEPLLEGSMSHGSDVPTSSTEITDFSATSIPPHGRRKSPQDNLLHFMRKTSISLRLLLWSRLREAYEAIDYPPKVFSICLRTIEILMNELKSSSFASKGPEEREALLLGWLRECRSLVQTLSAMLEDRDKAFECVDMTHLQASINAVADLWNVLYAVALYDDYSTAGGKGGSNRNPFRFYPSELYYTASVMFHDLQANVAILLYKLILEGMTQMPEAFEDPVDDRMVYLRHFHYHFGVRRLCKAGDQAFLKFMKDELVLLGQPTKQVSDDLAQVLYDLYDIHTFSSSWEKWDHGCDPDYFDKDTAVQILPFVMAKAESTNIKDLMKSDLSKTIEKIHSTLGQIKSTSAVIRNRKLLNAYLKSPIRPLELFRCLEGNDELIAIPLAASEALVASKGWYFLRGQMIMTRVNAQRAKGAQIAEEDLQSAITFFMQDLEYDPEHWETWFRLGQVYDALLEQQVLFSAENLNNEQEEVQVTQRAAIHAYAAAVAAALRTADPTQETATKLAELYSDFGTRIYASSRPPFSMGAFAPKDSSIRHFSGEYQIRGRSHYQLEAYSAMDPLTAWRLASNLLTRATKLRPDSWWTHFILGKCLWKIHNAYDGFVADHPSQAVQEAFIRSVETLPPLKKSDRDEPILDSIFRAVFIAHKLVLRDELLDEEGAELITTILEKQNQFDVPRMPALRRFATWSDYMLHVYRLLRDADKKSWHHRIVNRAAELIHRLPPNPEDRGSFAKDYLVHEKVYNKAYTITIWKPENERPGRHWVYMTKYASFVAKVFEETEDLEGLATLARRIRKKPAEYYEHTTLWEEMCQLHIKLYRRYGKVTEAIADTVFQNIDVAEFAEQAKLIDAWTLATSPAHPLRDTLRETAELKKINAGLYPLADIDALIGDAYAMIWRDIGPTLRPAAIKVEIASISLSTASGAQTPISPSRPDSRSIMSLNNLMNMDGATDSRPIFSAFSPHSMSRPVSRHVTPPHQAGPSSELTRIQEHTPKQPRPRMISRREILKKASDTVAPLKVLASAATAARQVTPPVSSNANKTAVEEPQVPTVVAEHNEVATRDSSIEGDADSRGSGRDSRVNSERNASDADDESDAEDGGDDDSDDEQDRGARLSVDGIDRPSPRVGDIQDQLMADVDDNAPRGGFMGANGPARHEEDIAMREG